MCIYVYIHGSPYFLNYIVSTSRLKHHPSAFQSILLDVHHTMFLADAFHERLELAVLQRSHVWEHVVFNLVVQPAIGDVHQIITAPGCLNSSKWYLSIYTYIDAYIYI